MNLTIFNYISTTNEYSKSGYKISLGQIARNIETATITNTDQTTLLSSKSKYINYRITISIYIKTYLTMNTDSKIFTKGLEFNDTKCNWGQELGILYDSESFKYYCNGKHSHSIEYLPQLFNKGKDQSSGEKFLNTFSHKDSGLAGLPNYVFKKVKPESTDDSNSSLLTSELKDQDNINTIRKVLNIGILTKTSTIPEVVNSTANVNVKRFQLTAKIFNKVNNLHGKIGKKQGQNVNLILKHKYGKLLSAINNGSFGEVQIYGKKIEDNNDMENIYYTFCNEGNIFYAVKVFKQKKPYVSLEAYNTSIKSEFVIGNSFFGKCSNIINIFDLIQLYDSKYIQVMELCPSGDLFNYIEVFSKKHSRIHVMEADCFIKQILNAVSFMHTNGIAHCDIKLENILLYPQGLLKLCDFGSSSVFQTAWKSDALRQKDKFGTQPYSAPEEHMNEPYDARLSDCWSCGVVYMTMILGHYMWSKASVEDDVRYKKFISEMQDSEKFNIFEGLIHSYPTRGQPRKRALYQIFTPDPNCRITVIRLLDTPWIKCIDCCQK